MHILYTIHHSLNRNTGAPGSTLALAESARRLGHEAHVLSHDDLPEAFRRKVALFGFPLLVFWHVIFGTGRGRYDWIDASTGDGWLLALIPRAWRPRMALRSHGLEHIEHQLLIEQVRKGNEQVSWKYWLYRGSIHLWLIAITARRCEICWALNHREATYLREQIGVRDDKVVLSPNGLDDVFVTSLPQSANHDDNRPLGVAFIGSFISRKGIQTLVPALTRFMRDSSGATLSLLGVGASPEAVLAAFSTHLHQRITVLSAFDRSNLSDHLRNMDVVLLPSRAEGFGKAVIEGMAIGLAAVASDRCGVLDHLCIGKEVWVYPYGDATRLAELLAELDRDRDRLAALKIAGQQAVARFTWDRITADRISVAAQRCTPTHIPQNTSQAMSRS